MPADPTEHRPGPVHWPSLLPDVAPSAWSELRGWVEALADRYDFDTRTLAPCWYLHNSIVETLSALHDFERISFDPNGSATGSMDFVRALRETEHRLLELSAKTQCSVHEHRTPPTQALVMDDQAWSAFVDADTRKRWTSLTGELEPGEDDGADSVPLNP